MLCCQLDGLEYLISFNTLCLLISCYHFYFANRHTSSLRPSPLFCFARQHMSSPRPSPRLRLARHPVFASPVAPSSPRPSPRLCLVRRPVFASPVAPSSPSPSPRGRPVIVSSLWYRCIL
ncbi:hypothetical protein OUZ56_025096 [Daphnia magna]|uniref:Uncharacterized protein n=1 Tax=Daphnia magna TaxID=35525 RepID=A0ABQ9ZIU7_9CRUS|nr:hypothetical protein OUZ56_025096 [Daphnia magna]